MVERDPTYAKSSTALSAGSIRLQFSTPENIQICKFSSEFIRNLDQHLSVDGERASVGFHEGGYLFLATKQGVPVRCSCQGGLRGGCLSSFVCVARPVQTSGRRRGTWNADTSDRWGGGVHACVRCTRAGARIKLRGAETARGGCGTAVVAAAARAVPLAECRRRGDGVAGSVGRGMARPVRPAAGTDACVHRLSLAATLCVHAEG